MLLFSHFNRQSYCIIDFPDPVTPTFNILDSIFLTCSSLQGYTKPKEFIASQGPKEELKEDFWRLVWEKNVHVIVMVTQCVEANKVRSACRWEKGKRNRKRTNEK